MRYSKDQQSLILSIIKPKERGGAKINLNRYFAIKSHKFRSANNIDKSVSMIENVRGK